MDAFVQRGHVGAQLGPKQAPQSAVLSPLRAGRTDSPVLPTVSSGFTAVSVTGPDGAPPPPLRVSAAPGWRIPVPTGLWHLVLCGREGVAHGHGRHTRSDRSKGTLPPGPGRGMATRVPLTALWLHVWLPQTCCPARMPGDARGRVGASFPAQQEAAGLRLCSPGSDPQPGAVLVGGQPQSLLPFGQNRFLRLS